MPETIDGRYAEIMKMDSAEVVREVVRVLSAPLTAVLGGVRDTRSVRQWMADGGTPRNGVDRMRAALQIIDVLKVHIHDDVIRAWFVGMNPMLNDESPLTLLAGGDSATFTRVMQAARRFGDELDG